MHDFDKIKPLKKEDRELLSDLKSTFDLGTKTIIEYDDDEIFDDLNNLMAEYNEDLKLESTP